MLAVCLPAGTGEGVRLKRKKKRVGLLTKLLLAAFAVYAAFQLVDLQLRINAASEEQQKLQAALEAQKLVQGAQGSMTEQETLLTALEQACRSCDSLCEAEASPNESAEETALQEIPAELLTRLRARNLCLRQLARHLVKGDTVYEA